MGTATEAYLDNSATTRCSDTVKDLVVKVLTEDYGNASSMHMKGVEAEKYIKEASQRIAKTLRCQGKEILYTSGGTESNNLAIIGTAMANQRAGKHIITTSIEHPSVKNPMVFLEEQGFSILREAMLTDEGKYYIVIEAARGTMRPGREQDYRFGADLIRKKDPVLLAYLEKEEKMTRQVLAGLTENDAQNKKETLEASEAGETAISRRAARINELTAYLALIEETRHEMQ